jgi:hypothetical protein
MTSGARCGELCAFAAFALRFEHSGSARPAARAQLRSNLKEKDTKRHEQRRVALDAETCAVLTEHTERWDACGSTTLRVYAAWVDKRALRWRNRSPTGSCLAIRDPH